MEGRQQAISAILLAVVITTGAFVPFVQPATAQNESPAPTLDDVDIPDEVTVGESFEVVVDASNDGGRAGAYSTITLSSPDLDESGDGSQVTVTDDFDHSYSAVSDAGDEIFDKNGDSLIGEYALAEAGTVQDTFWDSGESRSFATEITPEETGTLKINIRTTLVDDEDSSEKYTAPSSGPEDQQGYTVRQYEVEVKKETEISAEIEDVDPPSGDYTPDEDATAETTIRNTGNVEHEFYVGYSVRGPDGEWRDNDRSTHESVWVEPGEEETIDVEWEVEDDAPTGEYDIWTSVYRDADGDQLEDRLDESRMMDVFEVETETEEYRLNADTDGEGGLEVDPPGFSTTSVDRNYEEGTEVELTAKPGPDSRFVEWSGDLGSADEDDRTIEVTMNEARDITAEFEEETEEYRLNADTDGEGRFEVYPPGFSTTSVDREYEEGTTVELTATSGPDSRFVEWTGDIGSADGDESTIEVTMDEARDITARFEEVSREYRLEADTDGDGGFEVYPPGFSTTSVDREYEEGTSVELTAAPGPDSRFVEWTGDIGFADETDRTIEVTMDEARDITAEFKEETKISAEIEDVDPPSGDYTAGEEIVTETTIRNTGNTEHEFYVGYSVRGPDGEWRDNDRSTHESVWVEPGEEETVDIEWEVEDDAPTGEYDIWTSVYRDADGDQLEGRLDDRQLTDVFAVAVENNPPSIDKDEPDGRTTVPLGETIEFEAEARDSDGDLDGVEWYVENEFTGDTSRLEGSGDSATWERSFNSSGTYKIEAVAFDEEESYSDATSWTITVKEPEEVDAEIVNIVGPSTVETEEPFSLGVRVRNTGSSERTFSVALPDSMGVDTDGPTEQQITLAGGESTLVQFKTTLYVPFSADGFQIEVSADGKTVVTEGHPISLQRTGVRLTFVDSSGNLLTDTRVVMEDAPPSYTNESGTIELTGLDSGEYTVEVGPAANPYAPVTVTVVNGEIQERRIQVSSGSTLEVTVADEQPIESAKVALYSPDGTAQTKRTNAKGKTAFRDLESESYSVYVSGDEINDDVIRSVSVSGEQKVDIEAEAAPESEPVALSGQLTTKQGDAIEDATIRVSGRSGVTELSTDSNGKFQTDAEYLPDETYTIRVSIDGAVWEYRRITPNEDSREFDLTVPAVAVATRRAEEAGENWQDSTTTGEALGSFVGFATESVKQSIFRGIRPDRYSFDEIPSEDIEEVDVSKACSDTHVTGTTECLESTNQLRHDRSIGSYGSMMGVASAFQNTVESVRSLPKAIYVLWQAVTDPMETAAGAFETFVYLTTHPEVLERIVERLPQRVIDQQKADNPFPEGNADHEQFADAWYSGYVTFVAAEMVVARGAGKAAQASKYASKVSSQFDSGRAYLKTVGGRDQLSAYMRNRQNLPDPTDAPGYTAVIRRTGDDGEEFREKLSDDELALFLKLEQTDGIPRERLKQFVEDSGSDGAFLVKNSIDKGDSDMLRWLFTVDQDSAHADIWDEWRENIAQKYAISRENKNLDDDEIGGGTHDDFRQYVGAVHKEAASDKVVGYRDHMKKVIEDRDGSTNQLSSRTSEAESVLRQARRNDVTQVVVEPEIEGTKKNIDLYVKRTGDRPEYVEVKEWTPRLGNSRGNNMRNLLFGGRNANAKFGEADNINGDAVVDVVVSQEHNRDELREIIEKEIRTYREEDGGEVHIDEIRLRDTSGATQTARITADDIEWGNVVGAAATKGTDEWDRIDAPNRPYASAPLSTAGTLTPS